MDKDSILRAAVQAAEQMDGSHQPQGIPPQPVPTSIQIASTRDAQGNKYVVATLMTPVGQNVYFFDPDTADKIAEGLKESARLARTGLEIAR